MSGWRMRVFHVREFPRVMDTRPPRPLAGLGFKYNVLPR